MIEDELPVARLLQRVLLEERFRPLVEHRGDTGGERAAGYLVW